MKLHNYFNDTLELLHIHNKNIIKIDVQFFVVTTTTSATVAEDAPVMLGVACPVFTQIASRLYETLTALCKFSFIFWFILFIKKFAKSYAYKPKYSIEISARYRPLGMPGDIKALINVCNEQIFKTIQLLTNS